MRSSGMKYVSVFSPHTYNMNKIHVPAKVLVPPVFHPPKWKRAPGREGGFACSEGESQDSDWESLAEEEQSQLGLQQRILAKEELEGLCWDELDSDSLEEDPLDEEQEGAERGTDSNDPQKDVGRGRKQQSLDKYSGLRYNPNWKNTRKVGEFPEAGKASQVAGGSSGVFSPGSFYLHPSGFSEEKDQQESKTQDSFSEFGSELVSFHEPNVTGSAEPVGLQTKEQECADGCHSKGSPGTCGRASPPQIQQDQPQRAKKNFVKKNKRTLGFPSKRINSYLELHNQKQQILQEQVPDPKTVDEEPLQGVPPFQTGKMKPEDKWYLRGQQLKESGFPSAKAFTETPCSDQHNKFSQRNKTNPNQSLKGRGFPRKDNHQPPGKAAEPKSWQQQRPGFQAAPSAVGQDKSSVLQECLCPGSGGSPETAKNSNSCLNNCLNSRHFANTSTYPCHPTFQHFTPAKVPSPAHPSKESRNYQQESPNGIPHPQQHSQHQSPVQPLAGAGSASGQAHPDQSNSSSAFNANFQGLVKDQGPFQDCKKSIHEDKSSPRATSRFAPMMEQLPQGILGLAGAPFADRWLLSLLPPAIPQLQSGSELDQERWEGNPVKINWSNADEYLMSMEKQKQPKVYKKPRSTKICKNLDVKLGGLGPDYEAIKEKKQKLKLQKEYSRQIKEYNMRNITFVQRLPAKPQVTSSVARQKALEYAKKIPRPKTFMTKQSDKEVEEEGVVPQTSDGINLPEIPSLEILRSRHEKEKEVVAALKALHIL